MLAGGYTDDATSVLFMMHSVCSALFQNIPAGTAVRFEPGEAKTVNLVEIGGNK